MRAVPPIRWRVVARLAARLADAPSVSDEVDVPSVIELSASTELCRPLFKERANALTKVQCVVALDRGRDLSVDHLLRPAVGPGEVALGDSDRHSRESCALGGEHVQTLVNPA